MQRAHSIAICAALVLQFAGVRHGVAQVPRPTAPESVEGDSVVTSIEEVYRRVISQSPALRARQQEIAIAQGVLTQARAPAANPELGLAAPSLTSGEVAGEFEASLSQEFEIGGQRSVRIRAADLGVDRARYAVRDASRLTLQVAGRAFYSAAAAQERLRVATEQLELIEELLTVTRIQAREGELSVMDANLAEIEAGRARAALFTADREARTARLELERIAGTTDGRDFDVGSPVGDPVLLPDLDSLLSAALGSRADLNAEAVAADQYDALAELARRESFPNLTVAVLLEREETNILTTDSGGGLITTSALSNPTIGVGFSLSLPVFQRNRGMIEERTAQAEQARFVVRSAEMRVRAEVEQAMQAYASASAEMEIYERDVLANARGNQGLLEIAFEAGKVGLPTLLLLRNQLLDAELGYWDAWLAARLAYVDLEAATGALPDDELLRAGKMP